MPATAAIGTVASGLFSVVTAIANFFFQGIFAFFGIFVVTFANFFSFFAYYGQMVTNLIGKEKFDIVQAPVTNPSITSEFGNILKLIAEEIRKTARELMLVYGPIIAGLPALVIMGIGFWLWSYTFQYSGPVLLKGASFAAIQITNILRILPLPLNLFTLFLSTIAVAWNVLMDIVIEILILIFRLVCPANPLTGNLFDDCPVIDLWFTFVITYWEFWLTMLTLIFQIISNIYVFIGNIICPGGVCGGFICSLTGQPPGCMFGVDVFINWFAQLVKDFFQLIFPLLQLFFAFWADVLSVIVFGLLAIAKPNSPDGPLGRLTTSTRQLPTVAVPNSDYQTFKDALILFENFIIDSVTLLIRIVRFMLTILDSLICNIFVDIVNCGAAKICYSFLRPVTLEIPIPATTIIVPITLNFQFLCPLFGFQKGKCICDATLYTDDLLSFLRSISAEFQQKCVVAKIANPTNSQYCITWTGKGMDSVQIEVFLPAYEQPPGVSDFVSGGWSTIGTAQTCLCAIKDVSVIDVAGETKLIHVYNPPIFHGIWVPCVIGQSSCSLTISVLSRIFN
jgi:hypothetical protein